MTHNQNSMQEPSFTLTRVFDAPRELVWKAYSEAEHLAKWWGPKGCPTRVARLDFCPGGIFHYAMKFADNEIWGKFIYREIVPQERIVFVISFSDSEGNTVRSPFSPTWPLEMLSTVELADENGKTRLITTGSPFNPTDEERQTFEEGRAGVEQGTNGTLDQLADFLASQKG